MYINKKEDYSFVDIKTVEKKYNAKFICAMGMKDRNGAWTDNIGVFFWNDNPKTELGHTNYFAILKQNGTVYIANGIFIDNLEFTAVKSDNGELIYSATVHDYATSKDKSVFIDGGRFYTKCSANAEMISLIIHKGDVCFAETKEKVMDEKEYKDFIKAEEKRKEKEFLDEKINPINKKSKSNKV